MKTHKTQILNALGIVLGFLLFVCFVPVVMWLVSGMPALWPVSPFRLFVVSLIAIVGLALSVWTIVYMKQRGKGNPMDAFGHELAPRTQCLMTRGPYRINRNPMLTGTLIYLVAPIVWIFTWQAVVVWAVFFVIMFIQVLSEEKRLLRDFGDDYRNYCRHTRRF